MPILNDIHSRLNATTVDRIIRPENISEIRDAIRHCATTKRSVAVGGGRHAMGGQQFCTNGTYLDMTGLTKVLSTDSDTGLIEVEAGITWPALLEATKKIPKTASAPDGWAVRQKQTGVDDVTIGGAIAANAHGRGLKMQPISGDIESFKIVTASGDLVNCSRTESPELFSLAIGGFGLFGVVYSVKLRLMPRMRLRRIVNIIDIDDAVPAIYRRVDEGCLFGDFQFAIDATGGEFMRRGVFACYLPEADTSSNPDAHADLPAEQWLGLLKLAHEDKRAAFKLYASHYLATDGQVYWSDRMQLSTYIPSYADFLARSNGPVPTSGPKNDESLLIGEHYVPPEKLLDFLQAARNILREDSAEVIYGTIRAIRKDTTAFLKWASHDWCCIVLNLRVVHTPDGIARAHSTFRKLTDASIALGGSFFLTYHRAATADQVLACYPGINDFFRKKIEYDPNRIFQSDWYRHYAGTIGGDQG